jgi:photosystem II stability/assembly factor-like uncharacterized protein
MHKSSLITGLVAGLVALLIGSAARAQTWRPLGPPGGDARTLASDPSQPGRLYLGTADGHIFGSEDSGEHWTLLGRASTRRDAVITAIVVDPRDANLLFASTWMQDPTAGGGVFRSQDGGHTWSPSGLDGQAVRALTMAPSNPDELVAGTLDGVYRSRDAARTWERISPELHQEIRNLDSLAVDPADPNTIYAGTFHLPWKTTDGGRSWRPIHAGMIDDSDVMSILIDRAHPGRIYSSACSGIYRSENAAAQWEKIQGIPYTARRTYVIAQDPQRGEDVYAATSEGLWKTADGGATWTRATPPDWVVNTVVVPGDRAGRVVIGTQQFGVLVSDDNGGHFHDANAGFFHRQILALALDAAKPDRVLAVLANAPEPILATDNEGKTWAPLGQGLRTEAILRVFAAPNGWWVSLAGGGLMHYTAGEKVWRRAGTITGSADMLAHPPRRSSRATRGALQPLAGVVNDMAFSSARWFAATQNGLLTSSDQGKTWTLNPIGPLTALPVQSVRVSPDGSKLWVVSLRGLVFSGDGGKTWAWHDLPLESHGALTLYVDPADRKILIATAHNGLYISRDGGESWRQAGSGLPSTPVQGFAMAGSVFLASMRTGGVYASLDSGRTWKRLGGTLADSFFPAVAASQEDPGIIFAASATEGLYQVDWRASSADASLAAPVPAN